LAGNADSLYPLFSFIVMAQSTYDSGIDYGMGKVNIDESTGIRYGVISASSLPDWFWETVESAGTDLDYEEAVETLRSEVKSAIRSALSDYSVTADYDALAQSVLDSIDVDYENTGDSTRYFYRSEDGTLEFNTTSDGLIFVTKSPVYALCSFCSPCAPGAGDLESAGNVKTYCLPADWFDPLFPAPYACHDVTPGFPLDPM
jgi:hypothetical protein